MSNYNYGTELRRTQTDLTVMECFDMLGPKLRAVINNARIMWSPRDLFVEGALRRKMSDDALSDLVRNNDAKMLAKLEAERAAMQGPWAPTEHQKSNRTPRLESKRPASVSKRTGRSRRPSSDWVKLAAARAAQRAVPRSDFARAT